MLIIGAGGFAKEVLEICKQNEELETLSFYDDVNDIKSPLFFDEFDILTSTKQAAAYFSTVDDRYTLGVGNPIIRQKLFKKFSALHGKISSTISTRANIGSYGVNIGVGTNLLDNATISNAVHIGMGCIIYYNVTITHDCVVGDFVEISPGVTLLGRVKVGNYVSLGAGSIILPNIVIGDNAIIGAGSVVTQDVPPNAVVVGAPGKIIKYNSHD